MLEGDVFYLFDAVNFFSVERGHCFHFPHDHQVGLVVYYEHAHHEEDLLTHCLLPPDFLRESLLTHH